MRQVELSADKEVLRRIGSRDWWFYSSKGAKSRFIDLLNQNPGHGSWYLLQDVYSTSYKCVFEKVHAGLKTQKKVIDRV